MALTPEQRARIELLLEESDAIYREAFERYVEQVSSPEVTAAIIQALENQDFETAVAIIRQNALTIGAAVPQAYQVVATATAAELVRELGDATVGFVFDPTSPRAAAIMRAERLGFIKDFTDKQIEVVRETLAVGLDQGQGAITVAREIRGVIGLNGPQARAVRNYRKLLSGNANDMREALTRDLRDRRSDKRVKRAIRDNEPLSPKEIDRMVERYRERARQLRAETIARTETTRSTSFARAEAFEQFTTQMGIGHNRMIRVWNATQDKRTRDAHAAMDLQERSMTMPFHFVDRDGTEGTINFPGDPDAPADMVINCRCVLTLKIAPPDGFTISP